MLFIDQNQYLSSYLEELNTYKIWKEDLKHIFFSSVDLYIIIDV